MSNGIRLRLNQIPMDEEARSLVKAMKSLGWRFKKWPNNSYNVCLYRRNKNIHEAIFDAGHIFTVDDLITTLKAGQESLVWCTISHIRHRVSSMKLVA